MESPQFGDMAAAVSTAMNNPPKLLIVGAFPPPNSKVNGGIVTACKALINSSLPLRIELALVDSTQVSNPPPSFPLRLLLALKRSFVFLIKFETSKPDAVLLFTAVGASLSEKGIMARYSKLRGIPALIFPRGGSVITDFDRAGFTRWNIQFALSSATKILCQGEQMQNFVTCELKRKIEDAPIIRNWTATSDFLAIGERRPRQKSDAPIKLLFVGWLDREKGVSELFNAFVEIAKTRNVLLELVGEGNFSKEARDIVKTCGLSDRVTFRGWLQGSNLVNAFRDANVFVLPSWSEGLPNAMIEAMATRLAVVVTSVGNIPSVIVDGQNGLLVPPKNVAELERALNKVIGDLALRNRLADQAYQFARDHFGVETAIEKFAALIEEVTGRPVPTVSLPCGLQKPDEDSTCAGS